MSEPGPTFVVAGCITRGDEVLLAQRNQPDSPQAHLHWELPGGKVELEESPHSALVREIHEEIGATIELTRMLPHVQSNIYSTAAGVVHAIVMAFECQLASTSQQPQPVEPSINAIRWVDRASVAQLDLLPGTLRFIDSLRRKDRVTYGAAETYVRLERVNAIGRATAFYEFRTVFDLWSDFNVLERQANLETRASRNRLRPNIREEDVLMYLIRRVRNLVKRGYQITFSNDPRIPIGIRTPQPRRLEQ